MTLHTDRTPQRGVRDDHRPSRVGWYVDGRHGDTLPLRQFAARASSDRAAHRVLVAPHGRLSGSVEWWRAAGWTVREVADGDVVSTLTAQVGRDLSATFPPERIMLACARRDYDAVATHAAARGVPCHRVPLEAAAGERTVKVDAARVWPARQTTVPLTRSDRVRLAAAAVVAVMGDTHRQVLIDEQLAALAGTLFPPVGHPPSLLGLLHGQRGLTVHDGRCTVFPAALAATHGLTAGDPHALRRAAAAVVHRRLGGPVLEIGQFRRLVATVVSPAALPSDPALVIEGLPRLRLAAGPDLRRMVVSDRWQVVARDGFAAATVAALHRSPDGEVGVDRLRAALVDLLPADALLGRLDETLAHVEGCRLLPAWFVDGDAASVAVAGRRRTDGAPPTVAVRCSRAETLTAVETVVRRLAGRPLPPQVLAGEVAAGLPDAAVVGPPLGLLLRHPQVQLSAEAHPYRLRVRLR